LEGANRKYPKIVYKNTRKAFERITQRFQSSFTAERLTKSGSPLTQNDTRPGLFRRSGGLARGLITKVRGDSMSNLEGAVGWWQPFQAMKAGVHEYGATITPKRSSYLAIPLDAVLTNTGRARFGYSPRDWPDTRVHKTKTGQLFIVQDQPGEQLLPLYILKKSVYIPPRLQFRKLWNKRSHRLSVQKEMLKALTKTVRDISTRLIS